MRIDREGELRGEKGEPPAATEQRSWERKGEGKLRRIYGGVMDGPAECCGH